MLHCGMLKKNSLQPCRKVQLNSTFRNGFCNFSRNVFGRCKVVTTSNDSCILGDKLHEKLYRVTAPQHRFSSINGSARDFSVVFFFFFYVRIKLWIILPNYKLKRHWHGDLTSSFRDFYVSLVVFGKYRDNTYYRKLKLRNAPRSPALYPATGYNLKKKSKESFENPRSKKEKM